MNAGYWNRPPRAERYRPSNPSMERALANLTGKTSATLGDLIALSGLGATVIIDTSQALYPLQVMSDGSMRVVE
jgi:hypothetical protein